MQTQDWKGKELDKDLLIEGNRIYSAATCVFVSRAVNSLLTDKKVSKGKYPQGVYLNKRAKKFRAQINIKSKAVHLGYFNTVDEAEFTYTTARASYIREIAAEESDEKIIIGLLRHAEKFEQRSNELKDD